MSLRLRLLLAVGAIAIVALVVADFATYSALRSSLYSQVDQELAHAPVPLLRATRSPGRSSARRRRATFGGSRPRPARERRSRGATATATAAIPPTSSASATSPSSTRTAASSTASSAPPTWATTRTGRSCPSTITGFTTQPDGTQVAYFTTGSIAAGGPSFRVRAQKVERHVDGVLVQAQTLGRPDQHAAHPLPDRARRDGRRTGVRSRGGVVARPPRAAAARGRRAHGGLHRRRQPRPAGPRRGAAHRGRPPGQGAQRHARAHSGGVRGPAGLRGSPEGVRAASAPVRR